MQEVDGLETPLIHSQGHSFIDRGTMYSAVSRASSRFRCRENDGTDFPI